MPSRNDDERNRPLYMISVAAELTGMHPQTLRIYESKGLVTPQRTSGNTRMYSQADVERLELITRLTDEGINLAGVVRILDMKERMAKQEAEIEELRRQLAAAREQLHEYEVRQTIATLAKRDDGSAALAQLMGRQSPRGLM